MAKKKDKKMDTSNAIVPAMPRGVTRHEPDDKRFKNKFEVKSSSSSRLHRISFDAAPGAGWWMCSCTGCIAHGHCKHLTSIGLHPTRSEIMQKRVGGQVQRKKLR